MKAGKNIIRRDEVNRKNLIVLVASVMLILALLLPGCGGAQVGGTDKTYRVLNPQGIFVPVETKALASRIDTLDGKTIWVLQAEADPVIMPALWEQLQRDYSNTTWKRTVTSSTSPKRLTEEEQKTAQAAIGGIGW